MLAINQHGIWKRVIIWVTILLIALISGQAIAQSDSPIVLRLDTALTPEELNDFEAALQAIDEAYPDWTVDHNNLDQAEFLAHLIASTASGADAPDVTRVGGLAAQQFIRDEAVLPLDSMIEASELDLDDFYAGSLDQFVWNDVLYGLPDTASPDLLFYNIDMFDAAGLEYPTNEWTHADMYEAALLLTLDENGNNATQEGFNPDAIVQWGWGTSPDSIFKRFMLQALGADFCVNEDCTEFDLDSPEMIEALEWWASMAHDDHAALYDAYGGTQTGVAGHPFNTGHAAMAYNGYFGIGQLDEAGDINYGVSLPLMSDDGEHFTALSTNGYMISANTEHAEAAWQLVQALTSPEFLSGTWVAEGNSLPSRRSVAETSLASGNSPQQEETVLASLEFGEVFRPFTQNAFPAYGATIEHFLSALRGETEVADAMAEAEVIANEILAPDRGE